MPLTAGVGTKPVVISETQPVYFAPQYKTRYPFYRWVGWWAGVLVMFFFSHTHTNKILEVYMYILPDHSKQAQINISLYGW